MLAKQPQGLQLALFLLLPTPPSPPPPPPHPSLSYELPGAAITNDHKRGSFKQQEFLLSQSWRPEV